jgi:opacity protein-like surface antigen
LIPPSQFSSRRRTGGRFVAVVIATLAAAPAAFAADLPSPAPVYSKASAPVALPASWTGFYLGGGVGNRSSQVDGDITPASINVFNDVCAPGSNFTCTGESLNSTGLRFSPYRGYNYQFATRWLAGIEGDAGFGSSTATLLSAFYPNTSLTNFTGVRGEYRYADFGTISNTDTRNCPAVACAPQPSLTFTDTLHLKTQIATFGVAYKFD